jgi:hypothetical protein
MKSLIKLSLACLILGGALYAPAVPKIGGADTINCPTGKILVCVKFVCRCVEQP